MHLEIFSIDIRMAQQEHFMKVCNMNMASRIRGTNESGVCSHYSDRKDADLVGSVMSEGFIDGQLYGMAE